MSQDGTFDDSVDGIEEFDETENDGLLDGTDTLDDDAVQDPLDVGYEPADKWSGANRFGTTRAEAAQGEPLDQRLAEEVPDVDPYADPPEDEDELARRGGVTEARAGRLVADDEGLGPDDEADVVAWDVGIDSGAATAEEAAVHVTDDDTDEGPLSNT